MKLYEVLQFHQSADRYKVLFLQPKMLFWNDCLYLELLVFWSLTVAILELIEINVFIQFVWPIWSFVDVHLVYLMLEMHLLQSRYVIVRIVQYCSYLLYQRVGLIQRNEEVSVTWGYWSWFLVGYLKRYASLYERTVVLHPDTVVSHHYSLNTV